MGKTIVSIVMGSDSDLEIMREAGKALEEFGIAYEMDVTSAHRSPERTAERMSSPVIGTTRIGSRLPRSISLVTVPLNPFHEIRNPRVHLWLRFSSLA